MAKRASSNSNGGNIRLREPDAAEETLLGLEDAPSLAVDGFQGAVITNGVVKINFFTIRNDPIRGRTFRKAECVMSISLTSLVATRDALDSIIGQFQRAVNSPGSAASGRKLSS